MTRHAAFRYLIGCLTPGLSALRAAELLQSAKSKAFDWESFVELASRARVAQNVLASAGANGLSDAFPTDVSSYFDGMAILNRQRNLLIKQEAIEIAAIFNEIDVTPIPIKGAAHLLSGLYPDSGDRFMIDLDFLVARDRVHDCAAALQARGYEIIREHGFPAHHHYPPMSRPGGVAIELHVDVLDHTSRGVLDVEEVFSTAIGLTVAGARFALPAPQARLIHAVAHAQLSDHDYVFGRLALRELLDFTLLCAAFPKAIDWTDVQRRFAGNGAAIALQYHVLAAQDLLGGPIDPSIQISPIARSLYRIAVWQVGYPRLLDLKVRMIWPAMQLKRALASVQSRRLLSANLRDGTWWRRQWQRLLGRPVDLS